MTRKTHPIRDELFALREQFVTVAGEIVSVAVEQDNDERKIDHVWISVRAGQCGPLQISVSTISRQSRALGLDPRVQLGVLSSSWNELPLAGVRLAAAFNYTELEAAQPISFVAQTRVELERLLVAKAKRAICVEGWGEFYMRAHVGIHQVHSRRASFAVTRDVVGRDGALQFYYAEPNVRELLLFKFCGQP